MSFAAGFLVEWVAAEILPALIVDVTSRSIQRLAETSRPASGTNLDCSDVSVREPRLRLVTSTRVVSAVGGRMRLEVTGLKSDPLRAAELETTLATIAGVERVVASATTGNVLIEFDPTITTIDAVRAAIDPQLPATPKRETPRRRVVNSMQLALGLS
jgi:hypothetical protein